MDKLACLDEASPCAYVRDVLDRCVPGGRFAPGAGNTIANYIPVSNYLLMLEEGLRWRH
jgi:uroporphyrinogen decarboxylase